MNKLTIKNIEELTITLKNHDLFRNIPEKNLNIVLSNSFIVELTKGEKLFEKNETYHKGVYFILDGVVLFIDKERLVSEMGYGAVLGITTFLGKSSYMIDAVAKDDVRLIFLPEICIYKLIGEFDDFKNKFYGLVSERLYLLKGDISTKSFGFAYKPVSMIMTTSLQSVLDSSRLLDAAKLMARKNVGSLVVVDKKNNLKGLINTKHIVHKFLSQDNIDLEAKVADYMLCDPVKVPKTYPAIEVLSEMQSKNQDYAVVVENEKPVGIISNKDILKLLHTSTAVYSLNIEHASNLDELRTIKEKLWSFVKNLMDHSRNTSDILPTISSIHLSIQKRVYDFCVEEFYRETNVRVTDIDHALIIMGSGARKEMMLNPDQDNGYIFSDSLSVSEIDHLMKFGEMFVEKLHYVGYEKCKGNVMVTNPDMSRKLSEWKKQIDSITTNAGDSGFTWSNIIFDMDLYYGNAALVNELRRFIGRVVSSRPLFLIQMLEAETQFKIPITFFGNFIVEKEGEHKGELNLKNSALTFITDIVRAFSLSNGILELNTVDRAKQLQIKEVLSEETVSKIMVAYETLVDLALHKEIKDAEAGRVASKYINPNELSVYNQNRLKNALGSISKLLNLSLRYFKGQF
ncbi:MAG: DUF294 nucleotidyltransferase-like domain-containing protein [Calditerrivibrio sp.]|nr:DUF294 nucleotidyltransferase-like domain-containing protein [Calditerrivibrio sp.]